MTDDADHDPLEELKAEEEQLRRERDRLKRKRDRLKRERFKTIITGSIACLAAIAAGTFAMWWQESLLPGLFVLAGGALLYGHIQAWRESRVTLSDLWGETDE